MTEIVGVKPDVLLSFHDFAAIPPIAQLDAVAATGADSVLTWEPWRHFGGEDYDRGAFPMADIAAGAFDDYLYRWADELVAHGSVVYLRFAHEPNGTWYPWSPAGGTEPETYVAAWRHVHDLFASKGASNVKWVWAPNVPVPQENRPIRQWYPGDEYVDVIGIDGYNWGTSTPDQSWIGPSDLFGSSLDELRSISADKPIVITEVGSAEQGGSKSDWIEELVAYLDEQPEVAGFVWFDHDKETDWRLGSSSESGAAMGQALRKAGLS
ncbi:glycosyl hydrolase [Rhodococcus yunnanensis]|uniref:Glycosyl hydrolase n=1 Tax=Rhodococcoides yunnanense TaxID=278209 RepID=A0ABU4B7Z0_9NOCA|nr:glycosyl hydrolase [Rhodococcus yunnanensis]MDV6260315.1 glycosyl hydrolase [Rhodococcus yunnanensis]